MNTQRKLSLAAAAMAGLLAGASSRAMATPVVSAPALGSSMTSARGASSLDANFGVRVVADAAKDIHDCAGKNTCKGNGGCKTGDQGCKGKNTCKGKGGCSTKSSKLASATEANLGTLLARTTDAAKDIHDCAGKNTCKGNGGCKTGDQGCKGKNTCKGKGGCSTKSSKLATASEANLGTLLARTADAAKDVHDCAGKNTCKGNGGCKTGDQGCKGKNTCKGKGGCSTKSV